MNSPFSNRPDNISANQYAYLKAHWHHHHMVSLARVFLIVAFLSLWELAAKKEWIDAFFFSSPGGILSYLYQMFLDHSLLHIRASRSSKP